MKTKLCFIKEWFKIAFIVSFTNCILFIGAATAQNIGINQPNPDSSAVLDVTSTDKGLLMPRMTTTQRDAITSPAQSLLIYNITTKCFEFWENGVWHSLGCACTPPSAPVATAGSEATAVQIAANWNISSGATGYYLDVATDSGFTSFVTGYDNLNVNNVLTYNVTGLTCGTTYYYRVRAYNTCGFGSNSNTITYSTASCFNCGSSFIDSRDGQTYTTVQIGTQCWMGKNLNIGTIINNTVEQTDDAIFEKYCYDNLTANCTTYGGLYEWAEMVQYYNGATNTSSWSPAPTGNLQGICPAEWHLPTDAEWTTMMTFLGGSSIAGGKIKETGTTHWMSPNTDATNSSGFTALPGGFRYAAVVFGFDNLGGTANFWSCSEGTTSGDAWNYIPAYNWGGINIFSSQKALGYTVRCIKD